MKAYGLERIHALGDLGELHGMKSSVYRLAGKGGDIRAQHKSKSKRKMRRIWKRLARRNANDDIKSCLFDLDNE